MWSRRGLLAYCLLPLSLILTGLIGLRRQLYARGLLASFRPPIPIVVVGNIFIGGTGKTPFTIWLVEALRQAGLTPGVVSRGYKTEYTETRAVLPDSVASDVGDEPILIAQQTRCPLYVGRKRTDAVKALLTAHPEINIIISDDGLQHYALQRDVEIVLFDERGVGNGWILPAGPLREPANRGGDFIVVNGARASVPIAGNIAHMELQGNVGVQLSHPEEKIALATLAKDHKKIVAAAGIGNPSRFFSLLHVAGLSFEEMPLPDHYDFSINPFAKIQADVILITEKDAVKCAQIDEIKNDPRIWFVPVKAHLDKTFEQRLISRILSHAGSPNK